MNVSREVAYDIEEGGGNGDRDSYSDKDSGEAVSFHAVSSEGCTCMQTYHGVMCHNV